MINSKIVEAVVEAALLKYKSTDPSDIYIGGNTNYSTCVELTIADKITIVGNYAGFLVTFRLENERIHSTSSNPFIFKKIDGSYTSRSQHDTYQFINPMGPFSKIWKNLKFIARSKQNFLQEKINIDILNKINKVVDINGVMFENDVLKGKDR